MKRLANTLYTAHRNRDRRSSPSLQVLTLAQGQRLTSDEQFSVDGTLIQAWVSRKSFIDFDEEAGRVIDAMDRLDSAIARLSLYERVRQKAAITPGVGASKGKVNVCGYGATAIPPYGAGSNT